MSTTRWSPPDLTRIIRRTVPVPVPVSADGPSGTQRTASVPSGRTYSAAEIAMTYAADAEARVLAGVVEGTAYPTYVTA